MSPLHLAVAFPVDRSDDPWDVVSDELTDVRRLGERLGNYRRFHISYLRSLAVLATWDGQSEQAIGHLCG